MLYMMPLSMVAISNGVRILDNDYVKIKNGLNELNSLDVDEVGICAVVKSSKDVDELIEVLNDIKSKF